MPPETIAVHCVAGLDGELIVLARALLEYGGVPPLGAVGYARERRKGVINQVYLKLADALQAAAQQEPGGVSGMREVCANAGWAHMLIW
ncbi:protein tyrosine phosphatase-like protein [Trypanosoma grayi]|uniref:protein tyrosine phosphatase-like protein n=1 Tax=Trypanosoma grayi TaxID=71804 RepID=UPI0004F44120|nr:protein tyrosine phosphatase-like protein [Trypanosoma grayi]KEG09928.1 protein tyrosine phosphatase-like protein [Trypanosoma grayi]